MPGRPSPLPRLPWIVAEIGSNHDGDLSQAVALIEAAAKAGADAVKFQLFSLPTLFQPEAFEKTLRLPDRSWRGVIEGLSTPLSWLPRLAEAARRRQVAFFCTPFDEERLAACLTLGMPAIKIASGDLTHHGLIAAARRSGLPVILSCGAANDAEIAAALAVAGRKAVLVDCVMRYPADPAEYGVARLAELGKRFGVPVGISDHSKSPVLAALATAAGAVYVEKHFTLDPDRQGADHAMALDPEAFRAMCEAVREAFLLARTRPKPRSDRKERTYARRGLYAAVPISAGTRFQARQLRALRPNCGVPVERLPELLGRKASRDYAPGEMIRIAEIKRKNY